MSCNVDGPDLVELSTNVPGLDLGDEPRRPPGGHLTLKAAMVSDLVELAP